MPHERVPISRRTDCSTGDGVQADQAREAFVRAAESARETADGCWRVPKRDLRAPTREYLATIAAPVGRSRRSSGTGIGSDEQRRHADACRRNHEERRVLADQAALALQMANRQVKVMERLRDRALARHREAERQMDMKALDELATLRYARRRADEGAANVAIDPTSGTNSDPTTAAGHAGRAAGHARQRRVPEAAGHPAAEPGSDQSAIEHGIHRAAGAVQLARAADQHQQGGDLDGDILRGRYPAEPRRRHNYADTTSGN